MTNRRDILRTAAAIPTLSVATTFGAPSQPESLACSLERFVFDVRFAESGAIAEHVERLGVPLSPIADDLMTLWYDELDLAWRKAPMALAGVTLADALFVLETFALDRGMHVVYRGEHGLVEDGRIVHRLAGPAPLIERLSPLPKAWESALATALTECPLGAPQIDAHRARHRRRRALVARHAAYSWIIAPRAAVSSRVES